MGQRNIFKVVLQYNLSKICLFVHFKDIRLDHKLYHKPKFDFVFDLELKSNQQIKLNSDRDLDYSPKFGGD